MLGVNSNHVMKQGKRQSKRDKKEIKVTYISSPMKVKTSASNFRALVQKLTGQDSNVAETFMEGNGVETHESVQKGSRTQQWSVGSECYLPEAANWFKTHDYSELLQSRSSLGQLNEHLQCDLLRFDFL